MENDDDSYGCTRKIITGPYTHATRDGHIWSGRERPPARAVSQSLSFKKYLRHFFLKKKKKKNIPMGGKKTSFFFRSSRSFLFIEKRLFVLADDLIAADPMLCGLAHHS